MRCFETFRTVDTESGVENWRAYFTDDCAPNQVGDWMPKPNAPVGRGDTELEAIAALCMTQEQIDGQFLFATNAPKYSIGQQVYVNASSFTWPMPSYYGKITYVHRNAHILADAKYGLRIYAPYDYVYTIEEYNGKEHRDVPEQIISVVEDDGA